MNLSANELTVNGIVYVPKYEAQSAMATIVDGLRCVIVRTYSAGVFLGYLKSKSGKEIELLNARRLWMWAGAASLSQLATDGTSDPTNCKFPCEVSKIELTEAIEILDVTEKAKNSIDKVKIWKR